MEWGLVGGERGEGGRVGGRGRKEKEEGEKRMEEEKEGGEKGGEEEREGRGEEGRVRGMKGVKRERKKGEERVRE